MGADPHMEFWDALVDRFIGKAQSELGSRSEVFLSEGRGMTFEDAAVRALEIGRKKA
jgi:hypothetical protein